LRAGKSESVSVFLQPDDTLRERISLRPTSLDE